MSNPLDIWPPIIVGSAPTPPATVQVWVPDAPPATPNALDYEGGSVASWTEWDYGSRIIPPYNDSGHLVLAHDGALGMTWAGAYKAAPASGQYTIVAKILAIGPFVSYSRFGLALFQNTTNTGDVQIVNRTMSPNVAAPTHYLTMASYNAGETVHQTTAMYPTYFRFRVNGTAVVAGVSCDGVSWQEFPSRTFTAGYFGPVISSEVLETVFLKMQWLRVFDGVYGRDSVTIGRFVDLAVP